MRPQPRNYVVQLTPGQCREATDWLSERLDELDSERDELEEHRPGLLEALKQLHGQLVGEDG